MDVQRRVSGESFAANNNNIKMIHFDSDLEAYQLKANETIVHATSENADAAAVLTLPSKAEMTGKMVYICATTGHTGGDISVYDKESGSEISTYGNLNADDDHVIFFCDGRNWRVLLNGVA
jgi:hypothetical protein